MRRYTSPKQEWHRVHPSQRGEERSTFSQISEGNLTYKVNQFNTTSHPMNIKISMNLVPSHLEGPSCSLREFITDWSMFGPQNGHRKPRHPNHLMQLHPPSGPGDLVALLNFLHSWMHFAFWWCLQLQVPLNHKWLCPHFGHTSARNAHWASACTICW